MDNIPASLGVGGAPAAAIKRTSIQALPGAGTFGEWRVQQAEGACAPLKAAGLPRVHGAGPVPYHAASRIERIPSGTVTRAPVASRSRTHVPAEPQAGISTPVAVRPAIDGFGRDTKPPLDSGAAEPGPPGARIELNEELGRALRNGYAKGIIDEGDTAVHPDADVAFRNIVVSFNRTMEDLLHRFPGLSSVEPPLLCRNDAHQAPGGTELPYYQPDRAAISFPVRDGPHRWSGTCAHHHIGPSARLPAIPDIVLHQYGHHLSSGQVVPAAIWEPKLRGVALANFRLWAVLAKPIEELPSRGHFPRQVISICGALSHQALPDRLLRELAAETLAWRLQPDYGQSNEAPIMPWCLEKWVRECFPFLVKPERSQPTRVAAANQRDTAPSASAAGPRAGRPGGPMLNPPSTSASGFAQRPRPGTDPSATLRFAQLTANKLLRQVTDSFDFRTRWFVNNCGFESAMEFRQALGNRYANGFVLPGGLFCPHPRTVADFTRLVFEYNNVMANFRERFPGLGETKPPYLSSNDLGADPHRFQHLSGPVYANYHALHHFIEFAHWADFSKWSRLVFHDGTTLHAPISGFPGVVAHEYGHHLSSDAVVPKAVWLPKMKAMLEAIPREPEAGLPENMHIPSQEVFRARYGMLIGAMGIGYCAGDSPAEFVAEAISWRLHPDYGGNSQAPRMPRYLENWVHECFPFLDNGQIPVRCCEVNPDFIKTRVKRNGKNVWVPRAQAQATEPVPVPETTSGPTPAAPHDDSLSPRPAVLESRH